MKKFNYNIIVFIAAAVLILAGWCSRVFWGGMKGAVVGFINETNVEAFIHSVDEASKNISYQGLLIDMTSLVNRLSDTRIVKKSDATVVRLDNGYLAYTAADSSDEALNEKADRFEALKDVTDKMNIPLLYVMAPAKAYYGGFPAGVANTYKDSYSRYANVLRTRGVHVLDLAQKMEQQGMTMEESFFITDHHWLPETGFWAAGEICEELQKEYGLTYDKALLELSNYDVQTHSDVFLGSEGKKVGQYFTPLGLDDISVITPKFETNLTVEDSAGVRSGTLENTMIEPFDFVDLDLYIDSMYAHYSYGDRGLQVVQNHLAGEEAPKVVIIRDSYACVVTPFLSLMTGSLHILDTRHWRGTDTANTIYEYIQQEQPDYVLVLYTGLGHTMPIP